MKRLAAFLAILAILAAAGAIVLLNLGEPNDTPTEVGKWLLQLATAFAVAGAVSAVIREVENLRAQRAAWANLLQDVIQANDTVLVARLLLAAHATAKTYSEQIQELIRVGATLRRIAAEPDVHKVPELRDAINRMYGYLARLALEYEDHYLPVTRQQRVDEERLKLLVQEAAKTPALEKLSAKKLADELREPMRAGQILKDAELFPNLAALRDGKEFEAGDFIAGYETAKRLLEKHAGIRRQERADDLRGRGSQSRPARAAQRLRHYCVDPHGTSFC